MNFKCGIFTSYIEPILCETIRACLINIKYLTVCFCDVTLLSFNIHNPYKNRIEFALWWKKLFQSIDESIHIKVYDMG